MQCLPLQVTLLLTLTSFPAQASIQSFKSDKNQATIMEVNENRIHFWYQPKYAGTTITMKFEENDDDKNVDTKAIVAKNNEDYEMGMLILPPSSSNLLFYEKEMISLKKFKRVKISSDRAVEWQWSKEFFIPDKKECRHKETSLQECQQNQTENTIELKVYKVTFLSITFVMVSMTLIFGMILIALIIIASRITSTFNKGKDTDEGLVTSTASAATRITPDAPQMRGIPLPPLPKPREDVIYEEWNERYGEQLADKAQGNGKSNVPMAKNDVPGILSSASAEP